MESFSGVGSSSEDENEDEDNHESESEDDILCCFGLKEGGKFLGVIVFL